MISLAVAAAGAALIAAVCLAVGRMSVTWTTTAAAEVAPCGQTSQPPLNAEFVVDVGTNGNEPAAPRMFNKRTGSTSFFEPDADAAAIKEENRKLQERLAEAEAALKNKTVAAEVAAVLTDVDPTTHLYNRKAFDDKLAECCEARGTLAEDAAVILMEIDQLRQIADRHGSPAGEFVLNRLAGVVRDTIGSEGFAARYGEEEFGVILPKVSVNRSKIIAERIRKNCDVAHDYIGSHLKTSVSLGVTDCSESLDLTLAGLDRALHAAKEAGCNRTFLCSGAELTQVEIAALTNSDINDKPTDEERKNAWFDRRNGRRAGFETMQWLAPFIPGKPIRRESFLEVRCRDISLGGFSFVLREKPDFDEVIVALGAEPNMTYVRAKVVHVANDTPMPGQLLIGCRFAERLQANPKSAPVA